MYENHRRFGSDDQASKKRVTRTADSRPISGVGIGLRGQHVAEILDRQPPLAWLEILADNHLDEGGLPARQLQVLAERYPMTLHCLGLSVASVEALDLNYCNKIKALAERTQAAWISDHLCFTSLHGRYSHELLPVPYNRESVEHCAEKISQIQDFFGERILIENVSAYMTFKDSEMSEAEFVTAVCEQADCGLLLDLNNVYVNQVNHGFDGLTYIDTMPLSRVREIHLAGYQQQPDYLLDAHNNPVGEPVWQLYQYFLEQVEDDIPVLIEWDNDLPPLSTLIAEADKAERLRLAGAVQCI